jgi:aspartyl-tRNA synthetase
MGEFSSRRTPAGPAWPATIGRSIVLLGWVHRVRNLGSLSFRHPAIGGLTQVVVRSGSGVGEAAVRIRPGMSSPCRA